jgi:hypothetical protein
LANIPESTITNAEADSLLLIKSDEQSATHALALV